MMAGIEGEGGMLVDAAALMAAEQAARAAREAKVGQVGMSMSTASTPGSIPGLAALGPKPVPTAQVRINQQWVGYIIGQGGDTLRQIRESSGASIQIDQATKEMGYSYVQIFGPPMNAEVARQLIEQKLAEVDPQRPAPADSCEIQVEQAVVGYLVGKGGETLKQLRIQSGAQIAVDQNSKERGYSMIRITGPEDAKQAAVDLINRKAEEARDPRRRINQAGGGCGGCGGCGGGPSFPAPEARGASVVFAEYKVQQSQISLLIGRAGETIRQIKEQSGATVVIDQSTKDQGFSMVRILPGQGAQLAAQLVEAKLQEIENNGGMSVEEIPIDPNLVDWVLGQNGENVTFIKDQTGATMVVSRDIPQSMVRLSGLPDEITHARNLVEQKLAEGQQALWYDMGFDTGMGPPAGPPANFNNKSQMGFGKGKSKGGQMAPMPPFNGGQKGFAGGKGGVIGMPPGKMKAAYDPFM